MKYIHNEIETKWQKYWAENKTFKAQQPTTNNQQPKYYVLDMFPYPSGAGLHVGHPLGYIASDIVARYKRHQGYNVLHPQGYDSFGLPAEQYAIQTGQHPEKTTRENIARYREQLDKIGFSFDWNREVRTSNPEYYKWTQWIFIELFNSYYCKETDQAQPIAELIKIFEANGNSTIHTVCDEDTPQFSATDWNSFTEEEQQKILLKYRLTFLSETEVNWCPALGTVLANDEVINGVSERGGHPVIRKKMMQWSMRITAYAERLLHGLETIDWTESIKESQRNWIGKSVGASVEFRIQNLESRISVFTTRPDTIYGVTFLTLAPEHELVTQITTPEQKPLVDAYIEATAKRSERDRMADVKTISGVFTGAYAIHPFTDELIPIWIGDYVLASYGTGAVMAVPAGDERDFAFAKHFNLSIKNIFDQDISEGAFTEKQNFTYINSDFLDGLGYEHGTKRVYAAIEALKIGAKKVNYRLRDAVFSRQRYWGEPIPIYYKKGVPYPIPTECLPLLLPEVEKYLPTEDGQPPLGNATHWAWDTQKLSVVSCDLIDDETIFPLELNTMPGWAGSSWYWLRYMDATNTDEFASKTNLDYWKNVDLYIGGSEHATGHLLYSRFWNKFLKDKGYINHEEPFKKLINQGMILGMSAFVYRMAKYDMIITKDKYLEFLAINNKKSHKVSLDENNRLVYEENFNNEEVLAQAIHVDVNLVNSSDELDIEAFKRSRPEFKNTMFTFDNGSVYAPGLTPVTLNDGKYTVGREVEKMSKSKYNVVNPDDICEQYGADTLRLYEMFLGPLEQAKPWNTAGISGVYGFLKKLWKLYHSGADDSFYINDDTPNAEALKTLHKTIKKVTDDIENFSFNTSVSQFMICVNELTTLKCNHRAVLEPLAILLSPYAPHIVEELWEKLGHQGSIARAPFPKFEEKYLVENEKEYPVSFNGKTRFTLTLPLSLSKEEIENIALNDPRTTKQLEGKQPNKVIVVPGKIINIVG